MTILQSLAAFYDRLDRRGSDGPAIVPSPGLKPVEIDFILEIDFDGRVIGLTPRSAAEGRRRAGKLMMPGTAYNPKPEKGASPWEDLSFGGRTSGRRSFVFWDKSSYVFGVAAEKAKGEAKVVRTPEISKKSREDHDAFVAAHRELLSGSTEPALLALLRFLDVWHPEHWSERGFPSDALDRNIAFAISGQHVRIDQMPAARTLARAVVVSAAQRRHCLVSGEMKPFVTRHPQFRVAGAQSSGAALVSYNADAFVSFEQDKAAAAPVSEDAAFKYGAALNWLLDRDNGRMFPLGETSVVFWADDKSDAAAIAAEEALRDQITDDAAPVATGTTTLDDDGDETGDDDGLADEDHDADAFDTAVMGAQAEDVRHQRRAPDMSKLDADTRLHVLGLSPNAGRIAVRFWLIDTWGHLADNIARFKQDIRIEPPDDKRPDKKVYAFLFETAVQGKQKNIPQRLGGEFARAILTGSPYPQTLFAAIVGRIRADKQINAARAGLCRAFMTRNFGREDFPVALDTESRDEAYNLGRLFAVYEYAERSVADRNATIKDKFIGAASATPRRVFPMLMRGYEHNASALAKADGNKRGAGIKAAKAVAQILAQFDGEMPFPTAMQLESQGRFFVGYYHQRQALYTKSDDKSTDTNDTEDTEL
ncbi:MAG: type I-C CRISPR-associated protein Cas8c/Csd1 [Hyphomicrobiaceae bacterium]